MQKHHAEKRKPERKQSAKSEFRQKDPLVDNGILGDALFITSLSTTGVLLKPREIKAEKSEISVPAKGEIHLTMESTVSSPLFGIALAVAATGIAFKYRLLNRYESLRKQS